MPGRIFISYRRSDSPKDARALYERLRREFGEGRVFIDLEGIEPGEDFVESLERQLQDCEVLVALIGRDWAEARNERGERRLDDENDFVRIELRTALARGIRVIPVLVDGGPMPSAKQLPDDLQKLVRRQAVSLDFHKFDTDIGRVVGAIRRVLEARAAAVATAADSHSAEPAASPATTTPTSAPIPVPPAAPPRQPPEPSAGPPPSRVRPAPPAPGSPAPKVPPVGPPPPRFKRPGTWLVVVAVASVLGWIAAGRQEGEPEQRTDATPPSPPQAQASVVTSPGTVTPPAPVLGPRTPTVSTAAKRFRDCDDPACPWLVAIGPGSFTMGSPASEEGRDDDEGPQHPVRIDYRLAVTETEITRGQFRAFVDATRRDMKGGCWTYKDGSWVDHVDRNWLETGFPQTDDHPVVCVSWNDAQAYARWLGNKTGQRYRLMAEAEWEFAARAGTTTRFSFGDDESALCGYANVADRTAKATFASWTTADCTDGYAYTAPVRSFKPNGWGLYDLHGNVSEWVQDCRRRKDYSGAPQDGSSVDDPNCTSRLLRGGAWVNEPRFARSAYRSDVHPANRYFDTGLRLTRMLP